MPKLIKDSSGNGKQIFEGRDLYSGYVSDYSTWFIGSKPIDSNFINLWQRGLYGKIDLFDVPILIREEKLTPIEETEPALFLLDFVYAQFVDMKRYFFNICQKNNIKVGKFWDGNIVKAFQDPKISYIEYRKKWDLGFWSWYYQTCQNSKVKTIEQFIGAFTYYKKYLNREPFTFSAFIASRFAPYNISGLIFEIDSAPFNDDENKINKYYDTNVFTIFLEAARRFGFMIDQNAPWRLVSDIDSLATQYYIRRSWDYTALKEKYAGKDLLNVDIAEDLDAFILKYADYDEYNQEAERIKTEDILVEYFQHSYLMEQGEDIFLFEEMKRMFLLDRPNACLESIDVSTLEIYAEIRELESNAERDLIGFVQKRVNILDKNKILEYVNSLVVL